MAIDYERMKRSGPKLKAMLTRATRDKTHPQYLERVKAACKAAVAEWDAVGAWIDDWSRWQRALDDAYFTHNHNNYDNQQTPKRLEEL
jgi:hypothetical protein